VPSTIIGPENEAVARVAATSFGSMPPGRSSRAAPRLKRSTASWAYASSPAAAHHAASAIAANISENT
jgi:hypothetical protein